DAVAAIAAAVRHGARHGVPREDLSILPPAPAFGTTRIVDEERSKTLLETAGVRFPRRRFGTADGVAAAARAIGFPVVLKGVSSNVPHNNRFGAVAVGLSDAAAVEAALAAMAA